MIQCFISPTVVKFLIFSTIKLKIGCVLYQIVDTLYILYFVRLIVFFTYIYLLGIIGN